MKTSPHRIYRSGRLIGSTTRGTRQRWWGLLMVDRKPIVVGWARSRRRAVRLVQLTENKRQKLEARP